MLKRIMHSLAPPIFADDEQKTRHAYLFNAIALSVFFGALVYRLFAPMEYILIIYLEMGVALAAWLAMRRGYGRAASIAIVTGTCVLLAISAFISGGVRAPLFSGFCVTILLAGLLLGWRATTGVTIFSILYGMVLIQADALGLLPESFEYGSTAYWVIDSILFVITGTMIILALQTTNHALRRANMELAERKQAEKTLRETQSFLTTLLELAPISIYACSLDNRFRLVNWQWEEDTQIKRADAIGHSLDEIFQTALARKYKEDNLLVANSGDLLSVEEWAETPNGLRCYYTLKFPLRDSDGLVESVGGLALDITERKQAEKNLNSQNGFLQLLHAMTRSIMVSADFDTMMNTLVSDMTKLLNADDCYITRWDSSKLQAFPIATTANLGRSYKESRFPPEKRNFTASALDAGTIITAVDAKNSPYTSPDIVSQFPLESIISIPLIFGKNKLGAAIVAYKEKHNFTKEEIERAQQAGDQIALALWSTQQEVEIQKRLRETNVLAKIGRALSETERVGLSTVLQLIVNSTKELILGAEQAVIHLWDEEQQILIAEAVIGYDEDATGWKAINIRPHQGVAGEVIVKGETINIADVRTDSRFIAFGKTPPSYRSLMVAPVQSGEKKLGTISVQSSLPDAFTEDESLLLSALGTQAVIAIENAHLLENVQQALKEVNTLYRINQGLVASLEPDKLLQDTVELLQNNFGYYYVQIYLHEPETGDFVLRGGSGEIGIRLKEKGYRLHAGDGIIGHAAETGAPFFTNHVDDVVFFIRNPLIPDTKSELAVPVKVGDQILGVLDIQQVPPAILSQHDIQLVSAVADQLAIALQKANLYKELQISLQQEKAIRNQLVQNERLAVMGRLLASVSHELNNPLQAIQNALFLLKKEKGISTQGKQDLNIVLAESERMANMIEHLRATYRPIQAEDFHPTQMNDIIEDVYALISPHLRHNQIAFEFHPQPELPAIPALSDQIRQVVLNLMMNAVEAMTTGDMLTVSTKLLDDTDEVLFTVSDTGAGISPALLPNIFEAFVTNKQKGTGLGLTITYDIVLKHGGRITAENNPDRGSMFKVWLPTKNREIE